MKRTKYLLMLTGLVVGQASRATMIPNSQNTELVLGYGVNPITEEVFEECVSFNNDSVEPADGATSIIFGSDPKNLPPTTSFEITKSVIESQSEFDHFRNWSASSSFRYMMGSGSWNYDQTNIHKISTDSVSVGLRARREYGRWMLKDVTVKPEYLKLYQDNPSEFFRRCGMEYVAGYKLGQGISVVLSLNKSSAYSYERISAEMKTSFSMAVVDASLNVNFMNIASSLLKMGSLNLFVRSYGMGQPALMGDLVRNSDDLQVYAGKLGDLVGSMIPNESIKTDFMTKPYPGIPYKYNFGLVEYKKQTLEMLYSAFRILLGDRGRLLETVNDGLLRFQGSACNDVVSLEECKKYFEALKERITMIESTLDMVNIEAKKCFDATDMNGCHYPEPLKMKVNDLHKIIWPKQYRYMNYVKALKRRIEEPIP